MNETNLQWDDLKLFLAVARAGGLSAAARATGKSAPTLARRMLALEASVGDELFIRLARGYQLTGPGEAMLARLTDVEARILPIAAAGSRAADELVKISAGSWMTYALCRLVGEIVRENETTRLRFISAEQALDISHRETVIGIRNRRPEKAGLAGRRIGEVRFAGYAVDAGVKTWVRVLGDTPSARWLAGQPRVERSIEVTAPRNALDLAAAGVARALLPTFIGNAEDSLQRVTPIITELTHDQWLVTHQDERFRPAVRITIDRIYDLASRLHA